ncbi:MAG TPA: hypothetical protein VIN10_10345 [Bacteroidales bacterium]
MKKILPYSVATLLAIFGLMTLFMSSSVIFDFFDIREKEGNYVLFVVWANFISSIIYLFSAYGIIKNQNWVVLFLGISLSILIAAFIGLIVHISTGGIYETKTIGAMIFRIIITLAFTLYAYFKIKKEKI